VFECDPWPVFERVLPISAVASEGEERVIVAVHIAVERGAAMSEPTERLAYDLHAASLSQRSVDAEFMTLMMAVETLLEQPKRAKAVADHVDALIERRMLPTCRTTRSIRLSGA
jgi:hypothetical protein